MNIKSAAAVFAMVGALCLAGCAGSNGYAVQPAWKSVTTKTIVADCVSGMVDSGGLTIYTKKGIISYCTTAANGSGREKMAKADIGE